jgi:arabinofuranosyltransferase
MVDNAELSLYKFYAQYKSLVHGAVVGMLAFYLIFRVAWVGDDALINVRTALNMQVGSGPVFNVGERVQGYTSPLWFWVSFAFGYIFNEYIVTSIVLSLLFACLSFAFLGSKSHNVYRLITVGLSIYFSSSILDYSTGGLENAIGMLCIVIFLNSTQSNTTRSQIVLGVSASLVFLTRFDYAILVIPLMACFFIGPQSRKSKFCVAAIALILPTLWFVFSKLYYDHFFPNTYYAKLNIDIPKSEMLLQGFRYILVSVELDPSILIVFFASFLAILLTKSRFHQVAFISSIGYLVYVVWIGGDFMAGRFFTAPLVIWLWNIGTAPTALPKVFERNLSVLISISFLFLCFQPMIENRPSYNSAEKNDFTLGGVADEAGYHRSRGSSLIGLILESKGDLVAFTDSQGNGRLFLVVQKQKLWFKSPVLPQGKERIVTITCGELGNLGISVGPEVHIIDTCGLVDPFLSKIKYSSNDFEWRIGHFSRTIPDGYEDAIRYSDPSYLVDTKLQRKLEMIWRDVRTN